MILDTSPLMLMGTAVWEMLRPAAAPANPLEKAHFTRVTDFFDRLRENSQVVMIDLPKEWP
jgi:predicted small integral membrane protein